MRLITPITDLRPLFTYQLNQIAHRKLQKQNRDLFYLENMQTTFN